MAEHERVLFAGARFQVVERMQKTTDGGAVPRQVVIHAGAVVVVPVMEGDLVCLIRNERVAVGKMLVELPAGTMEPPATPLAMAKRELREETGYTARDWRELPGFYVSPGILCERMHVFVAQGLREGAPERESGENIDNLVVPWAEALAMIDRGEIEDAKTICGLLLWDRERPR